MGEAKRRKKLDPNYGKTSKSKDLLRPKKNHLFPEFDFDDLEDEDDEYNDKTLLNISFDYKVQCTTDDNHEISSSGHINCGEHVNTSSLECMDVTTPFSMAYQAALEHFYTFEVEKKGHYGISNINITIENLEFR